LSFPELTNVNTSIAARARAMRRVFFITVSICLDFVEYANVGETNKPIALRGC
jgi:hypothetical protein